MVATETHEESEPDLMIGTPEKSAPVTLAPIRVLTGSEPAIVVPYATDAWLGIKRIGKCEIYALPEAAPPEVFDPFWWTQLHERDVTFWPVDAWSGHIFTLVLLELRLHPPFAALRWIWPKPGNLGEMASIETLWVAPRKESAKLPVAG